MLRRLELACIFAGVMLLAFTQIEGVSSVLDVAWTAWKHGQRPLAERSHTRYDAELGWVNLPGVRLPALYGPGIALTTNARGFRGVGGVEARAAPGTTRIVCSGDSFTLGFGVADDQTWCHLLSTLAPRRESVNLGQGGYGIDQAWLWWRRDAADLEQHLHLFAFITDDFTRMLSSDFHGYGKPVLRFDGDHLVVGNVPVPRRAYYVPWLTENLRFLRQLRSVELLGGLYARLRPREDARRRGPAEALPLALGVFSELAREDRARGSRLVLVYLPDKRDYISEPEGDLRRRLADEVARRHLLLVDLIPALRALPSERLERLYFPDAAGAVPHVGGHYTTEGNRFVADALDAQLRALHAPEE